jgi:hypothetical protein
MAVAKKRAPNKARIQKVDMQDASAPTGAFAEPIPAEAKPAVSGTDLGFSRREGVSFRMADLMDELAQRTTAKLPPSLVVRRDLKRYYAAIQWERDALESEGRTADDWSLLRMCLAGATFDTPKQVRMMWAYAAESLGFESPLTQMLRDAPLPRLYAILDGLESLAPDVYPVPASVPGPVSAVAEPAATYVATAVPHGQ